MFCLLSAYSASTRWRHRSMVAALLRTTSSAIDEPTRGDALQDVSSLLVAPPWRAII